MSLPDIDSIPPGSTVPLDQLSSMFATISTNDGLDLGQLSGLLAQESTQGGSSPTSVVVAASPTSEAPAANTPAPSASNNNGDGGLGPSQSIVDNNPGFQSSLQALLGTSVTLDVPTAGANTGNAASGSDAPSPSGTDSPSATITESPTGGSGGSGTGPGFTLPTFPAVTLSDSPSAPANTDSSSGGGFLGNIFDGIFGTNSVQIPQSWSELFVKTVDWNTLYNGSPGTIDSSGNIIPMPTATGSDLPAPVVTGSVITLAASPLPTSSGSSSGGGILGWIGGLFGGDDSSSQAPVATAPVTVVTGTALVTVTSCSDSPCPISPTSVAPSPSTILPPNNGGAAPSPTGPTQANAAGNLHVVVPLLAVPLLALL